VEKLKPDIIYWCQHTSNSCTLWWA